MLGEWIEGRGPVKGKGTAGEASQLITEDMVGLRLLLIRILNM